MQRLDLPQDLRCRRQFGLFSDFTTAPVRQRTVHRQTALAAGVDLAATAFFVAPTRSFQRRVLLTADGTATGIDASNTSTWTILAGSTPLLEATFDDSAPFPASGATVVLGTLDASLAPNVPLKFSVTNGTTAATPAVVLSVEYEDATAWPDAPWSIVAPDGGAPTAADAPAGRLTLSPSDATAAANDEAYLISARDLFRFAAGKPFVAEVRLQWTDADPETASANLLFGLLAAAGENSLRDAAAGPPTTFDGAVLFKPAGESVWTAAAAVGTPTRTRTTSPAVGGAAFHTLRIEFTSFSETTGSVVYLIDGMLARDEHGRPITHDVNFTDADPLRLVVGVKNGTAAAEALVLDYLGCWQLR